MPTVVPDLAGGALAYRYFLDWEKAYAERARNLGGTLTIFPLGDPRRGAIGSTSMTTRAQQFGSAQTATWTTAPNALATPYKLEPETGAGYTTSRLYGPSGIPLITFNNNGEKVSVPDADYWTPALTPFSLFWCGILTDNGSNLFYKGTGGSGSNSEWGLRADLTSIRCQFLLSDTTAAVVINRRADANLPSGPVHIVATYDGAANMDGSVIYVNGVAVASTATNNGAFVTVRNNTAAPTVMATSTGSNYASGPVCGGPFGPARTQTQVTAQQVVNDFRLWQAHMGLG